jgi:hypothetical protein
MPTIHKWDSANWWRVILCQSDKEFNAVRKKWASKRTRYPSPHAWWES